MANLLWHPKNHRLGDITIIHVGELYHLFTEQSPLHTTAVLEGAPESNVRTMGHAISKDMFEWEELPPAIGCGPPGSFDYHSIYHMDAYVHDGTWYMHYTGLDKFGSGEQQSIGLATSRDGMHWEKHSSNPVLRADPRWYEQRIPKEAAYQAKDFDRLWFRDPCIIRDSQTGKFGMIVIARDKTRHPDVRACLAWATSDDLVQWEPHAPIYSPGRFHTVETPSIFERNGLHYLVYMSGSYWGTPLIMSDPYQNTGNFYAISRNGWMGPYEPPKDEILMAATNQMRMGAARLVEGPNGEYFYYGWLFLNSLSPANTGDDVPSRRVHGIVVPPPRRVRFMDDGQIQVVWHEGLERYADKIALPPTPALGSAFAKLDHGIVGKSFSAPAVALYPGNFKDVIFSVRLRFLRGERAGLVLRSDDAAKAGWQIVVDRRLRRVEFGILGRDGFVDARGWTPSDEVAIKVVACQESVEVYLDDRLMLHQVRHRETDGQIGLLVDKAQASFVDAQLHCLRAGALP